MTKNSYSSTIGDFFLGATIASFPLYGVRFAIFGVPWNVPEVLTLCASVVLLSHGREFSIFIINVFRERLLLLAVAALLCGLIVSSFADHVVSARELGIIKGWFILPLLVGILVAWRAQDEEMRNFFLWAWSGSVFVVALVSLWYWGVGDLTYDGRLRGFYLSPNHLALFLAPAVSAGILFFITTAWRLARFFGGILLLVSGGALILTFSQAAWGAVAGGVAVGIAFAPLTRKRKRRWLSVLVLVLVFFVAIFLTGREVQDLSLDGERSSIASRLMIYRAALMIGAEHPFVGIGPGNFQDAYLAHQKYFPPYLEWAVPQPHNLFLAFWLQTGILGLCGFLLLFVVWIKKVVLLIQTKQSAAACATALCAAMMTMLLHGLADTPYWKNDLAFLFWFLIGMGAALFLSIISANKTKSSIG